MKYDVDEWDVLSRLGIEPLSPLKIDSNLEEITRWIDEFAYEDRVDTAVFGCGEGRLVEYIADNYPNAEITGLEHSHEMAEKARENVREYKNAEIKETDGIKYLEEADEQFNILFSINSAQETENPDYTVNNTFYNSLKDNGLFVGTFPGRDNTLPTTNDAETGEKILKLDLSHERLDKEFSENYDGYLEESTVPDLKQSYLTGKEKSKAFNNFERIIDDFMDVEDESVDDIIALADSGQEYSKNSDNPKTDYVVARKTEWC